MDTEICLCPYIAGQGCPMVREVLQDSLLQEANLPLSMQLMHLPHLSSGPCFLQLSHHGCLFLLLSPPAGYWHSGMCAHVVGSTYFSARFLVLIHAVTMQTVMPIKRGELEQSGNKWPEVGNVQVGLRSFHLWSFCLNCLQQLRLGVGSALKSVLDETDSSECKLVANNLRVMGSEKHFLSY